MPNNQEYPFEVVKPGIISYRDGLKLQEYWHQKVSSTTHRPVILMLEHTPVITLGKNADSGNLLTSENMLKKHHIDLFRSDRGGQITAHMPGQLVIYPVIKLAGFGLSVKKYVCLLEKATIRLLQRYGIQSAGDPCNPGVWVGQEKIAAIGIRIKKRTSMHGLALNIHSDLSVFRHIVPCGISDRGVTSLTSLTGTGVSLNRVADEWLREFSQLLPASDGTETHPVPSGRGHGYTENTPEPLQGCRLG